MKHYKFRLYTESMYKNKDGIFIIQTHYWKTIVVPFDRLKNVINLFKGICSKIECVEILK